MSTDADWEKWGKMDPYFGVFTDDKFRLQNLTDEAKKDFFESGKRHIRHVLEICRKHFDDGFAPKRVLDFGCGTGRLVVPLSEVADETVGVDISEPMLKEARKNCATFTTGSVKLLKSDDELSCLEGKFDLIHSVVVFQHIPVTRGRVLFQKLLDHLSEGGICALHFTYAKSRLRDSYGVPSPLMSVLIRTRRFWKNLWRTNFTNRGPVMQMNPYNLNKLFFILQSIGVGDVHSEFVNHDGQWGVMLYFRRSRVAAK